MKFHLKSLYLLLLIALCAACTSDTLVTNKNANPNGLWRQIGYGRILELNDSTIKVFDLNAIHCMLAFEEDILDFAEVIGVKGDTLTLKHGIDMWKCVRIEELPDLCQNLESKLNSDPVLNYDVFWHSFKEHYCSFQLKNVDWDKVNEQFRPKVTAETTELELFLLFEEMISLLEDGHIEMELPNSIEDEYEAMQDQAAGKYNVLDLFETAEALASMYVDSLRSFNAGMTRWGMIGKETGYVQINSMLMQAHYGLDPNMTLSEFEVPYWVENVSKKKDEIHRQEEAAGMKETLEGVLDELSNATSFIIDLRFNGGGKDGVAMEVINHFSSKRGALAKKYVYECGKSVNPQDLISKPSENGFDGPVYILTSHLTASAAELTVLCSLADDQFIRIGSNTEGIFSSTLDKKLPNGWEYEFSNEVYTDLLGGNYEHSGIDPDIRINYSEDRDKFLDQLKTGIELGLDSALYQAMERSKAKKRVE